MKPRIIVHVDMDAFYAAVEQLDHPEYRGKPVVVGADPAGGRGRGVVSASSYEARAFGIRSAMPISEAWRRCPQAVFLRPRFTRYEEVSRKVMDILSGFSPKLEQLSIDEAFLDCTGTEGLFGDPARLGGRIREAIYRETGLTASVGIASNKSVAKIASDLCKPDGLMLCPPGREREFLAPLPVTRLWGAGEKTRRKLERLGYRTAGDLAGEERETLIRHLGAWGGKLWDLANGLDHRPVEGSEPRKSISEETTFGEDTGDRRRIEAVLFAIADRLTARMRAERLRARTVTLKIRLEGFETHTRSRTLDRYVDDTAAVRDVGVALFRAFDTGGRRVRLVGIGLSSLRAAEARGQLDLFGREQPAGQGGEAAQADRVLDMMRRLYGDKVTRGAFLPPRPHGEDDSGPDAG